jgi:hypothetical protein
LLAACGNSGGAKTVTVPSTAPPATADATGAANTGAAPAAGPTLETLATDINDALVIYRQRFANGGRQGTLAKRLAVLTELNAGAAQADKAVAAAAAASAVGSTASGFGALREVTQPLATFMQGAAAAKTPAEVAGVWCNVRALDRLFRAVQAGEVKVNTFAAQLNASAAAPFAVAKPTRGAWNVAVAAGCLGALRDQFTQLSTAAKRKQASRAARAADSIRSAMEQVARGMGPGLAKDNPAAVTGAAAALRDLARLEASYMALVARSWRRHPVSAASRKRLEAEIPNAFKRAADRVQRSGALKLS